MSEEKRQSSNVLAQATILMVAGIITRIIGVLYRSPVTSIIGDEGNGYYGIAVNIYTMILLISSYSIPMAVSKVVSGKLALRQYKDAHKVFRCALIYVFVVGSIASLITFFGASLLIPESQAKAVPVLRVLAPTIFFSGFLGVLRGYFQAHGTMLPTSLSQIVEQIANAVVSIGAAILFIRLFAGIAQQFDYTDFAPVIKNAVLRKDFVIRFICRLKRFYIVTTVKGIFRHTGNTYTTGRIIPLLIRRKEVIHPNFGIRQLDDRHKCT